MSPFARSIYKTLAFFDAQDLPLTLGEIRNYLAADTVLPKEISLKKLEETLKEELQDWIGTGQGFYFLKGRNKLFKLRQERYQISCSRSRKAKKYLYGLRYLPYLRAVAISGSQAILSSTRGSDIDLFLITKKNRIWLARLLVSLYFQVLGQRRYRQHIAGRFCLNHYLVEGAKITQDQNFYTATEYLSLLPILGKEELQNFLGKNTWPKRFLLCPQPEFRNSYFAFKFSPLQKVLEAILDFTIGPFLNWLAGCYQKRRIKMQEHILVSDQELSFHPASRGQKILAKFQQTLQFFGIDPVRH